MLFKMAGKSKSASNSNSKNGAALGFEAQLWAAADKMRGHMDASEYKHVCLGLIFLKYISDAFEEKRQLLFGFSDPKSRWFTKAGTTTRRSRREPRRIRSRQTFQDSETAICGLRQHPFARVA